MAAKYQHEKPAPTIERLVALMRRGYRIREQDLADANNYVSLEHPAHWQKLREKSLFLYDDGSVMGGPRIDDTCLLIEPADAAEFSKLVTSTPTPTWWERNNGPFYTVWAWLVIGVFMLVFVKVFDFAWDAIFGK